MWYLKRQRIVMAITIISWWPQVNMHTRYGLSFQRVDINSIHNNIIDHIFKLLATWGIVLEMFSFSKNSKSLHEYYWKHQHYYFHMNVHYLWFFQSTLSNCIFLDLFYFMLWVICLHVNIPHMFLMTLNT